MLTLFLFGVVSLNSVYGQYQVQSWTTEEGLPQNTVYSIIQTPDGYIWLTTLDGLVRFDGVRFTVFTKANTPGIESNRFTQLVVDKNGNLWAGTENNEVVRYSGGVFQTIRLGDGTGDYVVRRLFLNAAGELVITTAADILRWDGVGFARYNRAGGEEPGDMLLWGRNGNLWHSSGRDIFRVRDGQRSEFELPGLKESTRIGKLFEDSRGRIWAGTSDSGLFYLENNRVNKFALPEQAAGKDIVANIEDRDGNIWAGSVIISPDGGAALVTTTETLAQGSITSVFQDREGTIWLGTVDNGIKRLIKQSVKFFSPANGLPHQGVNPIFQDAAGDVWVGGADLAKYSGGVFSKVEGRGKLPKTVTAIAQDRAGRHWFGHWGGAYYLENDRFIDFYEKFGHPLSVYAIHEGSDGAMWFAANGGLYRYADGAMKAFTTADGLAGNDVKAIHESKDGTLWIGTYGGLSKIQNGAITSFKTADGLASDLVRSIYEDAEGVLWIGSYDGGLTRLKDGKFTKYTTREGLFNDGVFQILEDGAGNLWMSSNRGIYRVAKQQLNDLADGKITRIGSFAYGKTDGMLETECNGGQQPAGIKTRDGRLWFPTQGGVAVIDATSVNVNPVAPPVIIEGAKIDNEPVSRGAVIELAPGKSSLEISYTGLSFIKPEFVSFRYKLEGQDENWVEAGDRRTAYYSYVPPGEYTFRVIAANSDGVWNTEGDSVKVIIRPPFYRTWWFIILCALLVIAAAYMLHRRRIVRLERSRKMQEDFSRSLLASQEQERQRIAAELHDSIGQSLLIIKNRAFLALSDLDEPDVVKEQLEELSSSATGAIEECREISYNLRPYQIDRFGLKKTLDGMFMRIADVTDIEVNIETEDVDDLFSAEAQTNIYRIVQESVNNIIKHSGATKAGLAIKRGAGNVEIVMRDNGCGFAATAVDEAKERKGGFGLVGITERARLLGGTTAIDAQPGQGTEITVILPVKLEI